MDGVKQSLTARLLTGQRAGFIEAFDQLDHVVFEVWNSHFSAGTRQHVVGGDATITPSLEDVLSRLDHFLVQAVEEYAV